MSQLYWDLQSGFTGQRTVVKGATLPLFWQALAALPGDGWTLTGYLRQDAMGNYYQCAVRYIQYPESFHFFIKPPFYVGSFPRGDLNQNGWGNR